MATNQQMKKLDKSGLAISVVVCTYNRAELLAIGLQTLCEQTLAITDYEVIVVDNNSKDNTRKVAEDFSRRFPNIRYFFEKQQGLSHARNRGWREARGDYIAYIDDECKAPTQWLATAKRIIDRLSPAVFGGPYYGYHNTLPPRWWKESYEAFEPCDTARALSPGEYIRGGNIFVQHSLLESMGGFEVSLGMSGSKLSYGEESHFQRRLRASMPEEMIYYDPELVIYHLVRPEKMTWRYIFSSRFSSGRHIYTVFWDNTPQSAGLPHLKLLTHGALVFLRFFGDLSIGVLRRDRKRFPYPQNYLYENTFEHVQTLGWIYERYIHC
jgi:glycosyltransferase involved in cell wall biosynthesis